MVDNEEGGERTTLQKSATRHAAMTPNTAAANAFVLDAASSEDLAELCVESYEHLEYFSAGVLAKSPSQFSSLNLLRGTSHFHSKNMVSDSLTRAYG